MKKLTLVGVMAMLCFYLYAQPPALKPLSIGDRVPDIVITSTNQVINYKDSTTRLSDFKGKVVILDFWATWCSSCIIHFAEEDSLQKLYKDELQVILVNSKNTGNSKETVQGFFNKRAKQGISFSIPSIVNDSILTSSFPHRFLPHYVWLNAKGVVSAITDADAFTASNISMLFKEGKINLPLKQDVMDYNSKKPLLQDGNGGNTGKLLFSGTLTRYLEGMGSGARINDNGVNKKITFLNQPILALYQAALGFDANRVVLFVKDSTRFFREDQTDSAWRNHLYCYEYTVPLNESKVEAARAMVNDLNSHFKLYGRMEAKEMPCYVLIKKGNGVKKIRTPSGVQPYIQLHDQPLSILLQDLNAQLITAPGTIFLDETGYAGNVSMKIYSTINNLPGLKGELQTYGFDLVPAKREMKVFVLSELKNNN